MTELYTVDAFGCAVSELDRLAEEMSKTTGRGLVDCYSELAKRDAELWRRHVLWERAVQSGKAYHIKPVPELVPYFEMYSLRRKMYELTTDIVTLTEADLMAVEPILESEQPSYWQLFGQYKNALKAKYPKVGRSALALMADKLVELKHPEVWARVKEARGD